MLLNTTCINILYKKKEIERPRKDRASVILPSTMNVIYVFQNVKRISSNVISKFFNSILE